MRHLSVAEAEIYRLKKLPKRPDIQASKLDEEKPKTEKDKEAEASKKPRSNGKKGKKDQLEIHRQEVVALAEAPSGWELVGYRPINCDLYDQLEIYAMQATLVLATLYKGNRRRKQNPDQIEN